MKSKVAKSAVGTVGMWFLWSSAAVLANDLAGVPIATMMAPGTAAGNVIYLDQNFPAAAVALGAPEYVWIFEAYYTVNDRLEINSISLNPEDNDTQTALNAAVALAKETPLSPGLVLGAYNLTSTDFGPTDNVSPYLVSAYNAHVPKEGPPSFADPVVRLHLGYGTEYHGDRWFGGVQVKVHPFGGFAILNYQDNPYYMVTLEARNPKGLEFTAGTIAGDKFIRAGYTWQP